MSLAEAMGRVSLQHDKHFLEMTEVGAASDSADADVQQEIRIPSDVSLLEADVTTGALPPLVDHPMATPPPETPPIVLAEPFVSPPRQTLVASSPKAPRPVVPLEESGDPLEGSAPEPAGRANVPPTPDGISPAAIGIILTDDERASQIANTKIQGSIIDGGSAIDMLEGRHPVPGLMSSREIARQNMIRAACLDLATPYPWPDFMPFPTDQELRELLHSDTTPEMIRNFELAKQKEADDMAARAREINEWIFNSGTMRLNEGAQMRRAARRDGFIHARNSGRMSDERLKSEFTADDISDADLYGDEFYGIRFAMLLNPDPANITRLRTAPVAAWGHDQLITLDGGRIRAREGELVVTSPSAQAAQMIVMEAKARGWETLRVSGNNDFCNAVKRAAKEAGLGAIIHRRGPLGLGPFSRPEIIMPPVPRSRLTVGMEKGHDKTRREAEAAAPTEDVETANALGGLLQAKRDFPVRAKRDVPASSQVKVEDPLALTGSAGHARDIPSGPLKDRSGPAPDEPAAPEPV